MMTQAQARAIARNVRGIATLARPSSKPSGWHFGGWTTKKSVWVVILPTGDVMSEVSG